MNDSESLQTSLAAMGFVELALAFVGLACYALALNGLMSPRARWIASGLFVVAGGAFAAFTTPWTNGIILVVVGVAGMGAFVALSWVISVACGFRRGARDLELDAGDAMTVEAEDPDARGGWRAAAPSAQASTH